MLDESNSDSGSSSSARDREIIQAAYADRVREAFRIFAENLTMGENERSSRERFLRAVEQTRKARDIALEAVAGTANAAEAAAAEEAARAQSQRQEADAGDGLSDEERALIEQALAGTTGQRAPEPLPGANSRSPLMRR
jgi:hypothetical protein